MQREPYRQIPLHTRGGSVRAYALVDAADYERLAAHRWHLDGGYAKRTIYPGKIGLRMHRVVLGLPPGRYPLVDHVNRNRLDNRRANLRTVATESESLQNKTSYRGATSSFRGVSWHKRDRKWAARVTIARQAVHLGSYDSELEAAEVAATYRRQHMPLSTEEPGPIAEPRVLRDGRGRHRARYVYFAIRLAKATTGLQQTEIAEMLGVSKNTVTTTLRRRF